MPEARRAEPNAERAALAPSATPILPTTVGKAAIPYARGIKAGAWVFATGHMAQTFPRGGLDPRVAAEELPHGGSPRNQKEAALVFDALEAVFAEAGAALCDIVRVDQYYPTFTAVDHYHVVRRKRLPTIPPSTSIVMRELSVPGAQMNVQAIGVIPAAGLSPRAISNPAIDAHPSSGYSATLCAGDYVFVAGMTPSARAGHASRDGLAEMAQMPPGMLWRSTPIKLQTEYIIAEKIVPALEAGGSSLANICKAQVYLADPADYAPFFDVWNRYVGATPAAVSVIPCANPGIGQASARIEINVLAVRDHGATKKQIIGGDIFVGYEGVPAAVKAGDLLFISGLMAVDRAGLVEAAKVDAAQPYLMSSAKAQMRRIVDQAEAICAAAGASLRNVVRIQQFHSDLRDLLPALEVWQDVLPGQPLPFAAIGVPDHMPAPGVGMIVDLWVHAP